MSRLLEEEPTTPPAYGPTCAPRPSSTVRQPGRRLRCHDHHDARDNQKSVNGTDGKDDRIGSRVRWLGVWASQRRARAPVRHPVFLDQQCRSVASDSHATHCALFGDCTDVSGRGFSCGCRERPRCLSSAFPPSEETVIAAESPRMTTTEQSPID